MGDRSRKRRGQVAVEAALILPLLIFVGLGIIQLTAMQHAKIMTEYAAFSAARAGIVWNGSNQRMRDAALFALLPTAGRTDDLPHLAASAARQRVTDLAIRKLPWDGTAPEEIHGSPLRGLVRVDTLNPTEASFQSVQRALRARQPLEEIDFDRTEQEAIRDAGVLTIRLRYWYELRIPFANWLVFVCWYAAHSAVALGGSIDRPELAAHPGQSIAGQSLSAPAVSTPFGYPVADADEMRTLWRLATGRLAAASLVGPRFYIPLDAVYSMRMQSNFYRKWLMHAGPLSWQ